MKVVSAEDAQLIEAVIAHLKQVEAATRYDSDEATLRVATGSLRFLLADQNLARAWRASNIGGPIVLKAWCIDTVGPGEIVALCGGGDILPNLPFSACRGATLKEKSLNLKDYCSSTRIQVGDAKISTVELIQYVANAMGGTHFDPSGKASKKANAPILKKLETGEIEAPQLRVNHRNLLHHEILSIAQSVIRSPQVAALRAWRPSVKALRPEGVG
jgi:hypothetical protein